MNIIQEMRKKYLDLFTEKIIPGWIAPNGRKAKLKALMITWEFTLSYRFDHEEFLQGSMSNFMKITVEEIFSNTEEEM